MINDTKKIRQTAMAGERRHYTLEIDFTIRSARFSKWVNEQEQMKGYSFPDSTKPFGGIKFSEPPQIKFHRKGYHGASRGVLLDADPITLGIWLVSDRLKAIYERVDPEACVFLRANVDYCNFPQPGPDYWFCYFMRELDCVDEQRSEIRYEDNIHGIKAYEYLSNVKMKPSAVGSAHAFRLKYAKHRLVVDNVAVDAMKAEKIRGYEFAPIQP